MLMVGLDLKGLFGDLLSLCSDSPGTHRLSAPCSRLASLLTCVPCACTVAAVPVPPAPHAPRFPSRGSALPAAGSVSHGDPRRIPLPTGWRGGAGPALSPCPPLPAARAPGLHLPACSAAAAVRLGQSARRRGEGRGPATGEAV